MLSELIKQITLNYSDENYRKYIAAKFTIYFAAFIMTVMTIFSFLTENIPIFRLDIIISTVLISAIFLARKKSLIFIAQSVVILISSGATVLVYLNKGGDGTTYWLFISVFFIMMLLGYKKGMYYTSIMFLITAVMMFNWIGDTLSLEEFIRFAVSSIVLISTIFFYELSISSIISELFKKNGELSTALNEIEVLGGLLPICSHCHSIRDDKGYWENIESYFQAHSHINFTHSICPGCQTELYSDLDFPEE
jgi:hypothetical protein